MKFLHNSGHERFDFDDLEDLKKKLEELNLELPFSEDYSQLFQKVKVGDRVLPNSLAIHPMEGADGSADGAPQFLTYRRYKRFGAGGSGLIWLEATAVEEKGRANPRQLLLNENTVSDFEKLRKQSLKAAADSMGEKHQPLIVVQLTHSGRYSCPEGEAKPIIAQHSEVVDPTHNLSKSYPVISDKELDQLQEKYVKAASLAAEAGFEAVDIKACHGYLLNELLGSHTRKDSKYGGSFENRIRFMVEVVEKVREENPDLILATRLNVYDAIPYPYGFGMDKDGSMQPDLTEPIKLIEILHDLGVDIVNVAVGNPYYNPHVERPFDTPAVGGGYIPKEHPLENIYENMNITREINQSISSEIITLASGLTWLRNFIPEVGSGLIKEKYCNIMGLGRMGFAYPDLAKDLIQEGKFHKEKSCVTCSSCKQMIRDGGNAGCPVRDSEVYAPIFQEGRLRDPEYVSELAKTCNDCSPSSCVEGCPADIDIPGFVQAIANREDKKAYDILRNKNNLPEVCAYTCPAEAQCEKYCIQNKIGQGAVPIQNLQKYVSEVAREKGWAKITFPDTISSKKVAVIGAGPAGLGCAVDLLGKGYQVTIFDAAKSTGGMVRDVIPEQRLKYQTLIDEVESILKNVPTDRLKWKMGTKLGKDVMLAEIRENYDAVFLGTGLQQSVSLPLGDDKPEQVYDALDFLKKAKFNDDFKLSGQIAVIGGGNTAMDAAVQAARHIDESGDVYLIYRRSFQQMPAWKGERENAQNEGVHFLILQQPQAYITDENGNLSGIKILRTKLGARDESGRRKPQVIKGSDQILDIDMVIEAVGQQISENLKREFENNKIKLENRLIKTKDKSYQTSSAEIFAGGDVINGGMTVVKAVSDGSKAAQEIEDYLQ